MGSPERCVRDKGTAFLIIFAKKIASKIQHRVHNMDLACNVVCKDYKENICTSNKLPSSLSLQNKIASKIQHRVHRMRTNSTSAARLFQTKRAQIQQTERDFKQLPHQAQGSMLDVTSCKKNALANQGQ